MRAIEAVTDISVGPRVVWAVLTDFPSYPEWAPYLQEIDGRPEVGASLRLVQGPPGAKPYVVRVPVVEATPGARLAWSAVIPGAAWLPAFVFTGTHEFVLSPLPDGTTRLTHREHFGGLVSRLSKEGPKGADEGFAAFNNAMKDRCEKLVSGLLALE
ncbi:SRPBCC domain-containing protein [Amycolatopsis sp. WAC 01375]|uniref:SRPBCC domain-containing protein n=1 Tax=unclassified Amycolatopsis TaxID=2618356 RepID=UPI000F77E7C5|nr:MULTISPECIES: SRPBCC domain-containing protein [unclassified Amycolatopsis]RSM69317.1 SRPBCC domain-containing protein [Amycolatopsis sp. WAC 01375]RSN30623.1 SRPBCC domain-containing protein [Amycolatopsis sp. WAC 01416]